MHPLGMVCPGPTVWLVGLFWACGLTGLICFLMSAGGCGSRLGGCWDGSCGRPCRVFSLRLKPVSCWRLFGLRGCSCVRMPFIGSFRGCTSLPPLFRWPRKQSGWRHWGIPPMCHGMRGSVLWRGWARPMGSRAVCGAVQALCLLGWLSSGLRWGGPGWGFDCASVVPIECSCSWATCGLA